MIDTIGCIIPISDEKFEHLRNKSIYTSRLDKISGSIEFEYDNLDVSMSYNYKVRVKLSDEKWIYDSSIKKTVKESGFPHICLEFSAPKIIYGHNLVSIDFDKAIEACMNVRQAFQRVYNCEILCIEHWYCYRLDVCANFILDSESEVINYIQHLQRMEYPRRDIRLYGDSGIFFKSRVNAFKIYAKGKEFKEHDKKKILNESDAKKLYDYAKKILRVECEIKDRLKYISNEHIKKNMTNNEKLELSQWSGHMKLLDIKQYINIKDELERVIKMYMKGMKTKFMESSDVMNILSKRYSLEQAESFYGMYMFIVTQGMKQARKRYTKNKMGRAIKAFRELEISFVSDVVKLVNVERGFPDDFTLEMSPNNKYYQVPVSMVA